MRSKLIYGFVFSAMVVWTVNGQTEVVLSERPEQSKPTPHRVPESRFGQAPADPLTGKIEYPYAAPRVDRSPAGLVLDREVKPKPQESNLKKEMNYQGALKASRLKQFPAGSKPPAQPSNLIPVGKKGIQEVAVIAGDMGYFPKTIFVTRDIPVRLFVTGASKSTLCIMMDSFQVRKQVRTQSIAEINFTPSSSGKFRFYCPINGMEGVLVVKELASR